ncbi:hypothetical protein [Marinitoga lauensis]|uniref:hypothetical protein n=1 Tax=Marinitoga lauensis TaxID=2201189 RepID=UPI001F0D3219|nr:hypothetical protein [Marinitoga lauensis]
MASATANVAKSITEISEKIRSIVSSIEQERRGSEEVANESQKLSDLAEKLNSITLKFKI